LTGTAFEIRPFIRADAPLLLDLMRSLAVFEGYDDEFRVTVDDLILHGLGPRPRFGAFVADDGRGRLLGGAVHYVIPWTYDLLPTLVLKELFVEANGRRQGVGKALMEAVFGEARRIGALRVHWQVLAGNEAAKAFYRGLGAARDAKWHSWGIRLEDGHEAGR
jgi:GNAT superfamily N-acetyltransferase